jgi:anaerobic selenocysteine-containing dehydrogenase
VDKLEDQMMEQTEIIRSTCGICHIGCGILVHVDHGKVVKIEGDPESPLNRGTLCPKGLASVEYLYHPERLEHPLRRSGKRGEGKWDRISWEEALTTIAGELKKVKENHGPLAVAFMRGGAKGLQDDYLTRFANVFGSPNVTGMAHVCAIPRRNASRLTYGYTAVPDLDHPPSAMVLWGVNAQETLHFVYQRVTEAVERGAKLIVINPQKIAAGTKADLWVKPRPGSDLALALGMLNVIVNEKLYDQIFVDQWTVGFEELRQHVQGYPPDRVSKITWVPPETIRQAARFYGTCKPASVLWGNAIDQGVNSFQTARALCILRAVTGNLEIPGGELRWVPPPVLDRGSPTFGLHERIPSEARRQRLTAGEKLLPISLYALAQGAFEAMASGEPYRIRAAFIQGCNALLSHSNAGKIDQALRQLNFLAVSDLFMTPTAALADIVLPVASYLEFDSIVEPHHYMPVVLVQQKITRVGERRSDYEILRDLALKLGLGADFWENEEEALDFLLAPAGISFEELKKIGHLRGTKQYRTYPSKGFPTSSGKVEIYSKPLEKWGFAPLPDYLEPPETPASAPGLSEDYPLMLTTGRIAHYRHSGGRQISSLRRQHPEPIAQIHPETARALGIADGDWISIETQRGRMKHRAKVMPEIDPKVVIAEFGWWFPEEGDVGRYGWSTSNVNTLTDDRPPFSREMGSTNLRGLLCRISKASA